MKYLVTKPPPASVLLAGLDTLEIALASTRLADVLARAAEDVEALPTTARPGRSR